MATGKTAVIERIFESLWDPTTRTLSRTVVTFDDVVSAINDVNAEGRVRPPVSAANPANFFKDFTRRTQSANANWPAAILRAGYTAVQLTGDRRCFEFVPLPEGQAMAFSCAVGAPPSGLDAHPISTASLPLPVRALVRSDEPSLLQLAVRLRVVETHMALFSSRKPFIRQIDHLQNSVKLRLSEIDAIFLATEEVASGEFENILISCEAKSRGQDITAEQLRRQPEALFEAMPEYTRVIPLVVRALGGSCIHVVEFAPFDRSPAGSPNVLMKASENVYELIPHIHGV